jgi:hypothetical protein
MGVLKASILTVIVGVLIISVGPKESAAGGIIDAEKLSQTSNAVPVLIGEGATYDEIPLRTDYLMKTGSFIRTQEYCLLGASSDIGKLKTRNSNSVDFGQLASFSGTKLTHQLVGVRDRLTVIRHDELAREGFSGGDVIVLNARDRNSWPMSGNEVFLGLLEGRLHIPQTRDGNSYSPDRRNHRPQSPQGTVLFGLYGLLGIVSLGIGISLLREVARPENAYSDTVETDRLVGCLAVVFGVLGQSLLLAYVIAYYC